MPYIRQIMKLTTESSIAVKIDGLEHAEKNYEGFRINIFDGFMKEIPNRNTEETCTDILVVNNLSPKVLYWIGGDVKINGEWEPVIGSNFAVIDNDMTGFYPPLRPNRGGAVSTVSVKVGGDKIT